MGFSDKNLSRIFVVLACAITFCVIWLRPEAPTLYGIDAACYASIAKLLAHRSFGFWPHVRWFSGAPFVEHPPLSLWLESLFFRGFGATTRVAVTCARIFSSVVVLLVEAGLIRVSLERRARHVRDAGAVSL